MKLEKLRHKYNPYGSPDAYKLGKYYLVKEYGWGYEHTWILSKHFPLMKGRNFPYNDQPITTVQWCIDRNYEITTNYNQGIKLLKELGDAI